MHTWLLSLASAVNFCRLVRIQNLTRWGGPRRTSYVTSYVDLDDHPSFEPQMYRQMLQEVARCRAGSIFGTPHHRCRTFFGMVTYTYCITARTTSGWGSAYQLNLSYPDGLLVCFLFTSNLLHFPKSAIFQEQCFISPWQTQEADVAWH